MTHPEEQPIPQYGTNKVKSPSCIILWSSTANISIQKNIENQLLSKNIRLEQLDGAKPENSFQRNKLFSISRKRAQYPQIFIQDENKQIKFIGMQTDIEFLIQSDNFSTVFRSCMNKNNSTADGSNVIDKQAEALRYKKLAEQWLGANNLFKAQKFARKSLRLDATKEVKELLDRIKESQVILQEKPPSLHKEESMDIEVNEEDAKVDIESDEKQQFQQQKKGVSAGEKTCNKDEPNELVNQLIEQSMALEKRNQQLQKENKLLKQKLIAAQDVSYEKQKHKVKGCIYECKLVKEYNSKQRNHIKIRSEVSGKQSKISNKMNGHKNRINEWKKHTLHLDKEFLKYNKDVINDKESEEKGNDSNELLLNVSKLYLSYTNCMKLLGEQQQRTEDVMTHCIDLNSETNKLKTENKNYNINVPNTKNNYDELCKQYDTLKQQRQNLQEKVSNLVIEINNLIDNENKINNEKCLTLDKYNLLTIELDQYSKLLTISRKLTNKYSEFEIAVDNKTIELNKHFKMQWDEHERNWHKWDINGIIFWLKYLMYDNKLRLSKQFNLKIIEQKMNEQQIKGASLCKMDKSDLKLCGFEVFDDRNQTYEMIRALVEKYPGPIQDRVLFKLDMNETPDSQKEGQQINIPKEYLCPISNKIMVNPVVAYDNKTYEKENIVKYIEKHKKAPGCEHECDGDEPLLRNKQLKTKIMKFLWANPQIQSQ